MGFYFKQSLSYFIILEVVFDSISSVCVQGRRFMSPSEEQFTQANYCSIKCSKGCGTTDK